MSTHEEFDPFATSTGLADDLDITIRNFRFGLDPAYTNQDDEMTLTGICDFVTDDPDVGTNGTIENQFITIGKGWESVDGGKKVQREDGRPKGFNNSTYLGAIIDACMQVGSDKMRARYEATQLTPMDAGFWESLTLHMEQTEYEAFSKKRTRLLPTEVKGWNEGKAKPAKKAAAKKVAAKKAAPKAEEVEVEEVAEETGPTLASLTEAIIAIAKTSEDDGGATFVERCYSEIEGLDANDEAMLLVDDVESEDSIWQTVGATEVE